MNHVRYNLSKLLITTAALVVATIVAGMISLSPCQLTRADRVYETLRLFVLEGRNCNDTFNVGKNSYAYVSEDYRWLYEIARFAGAAATFSAALSVFIVVLRESITQFLDWLGFFLPFPLGERKIVLGYYENSHVNLPYGFQQAKRVIKVVGFLPERIKWPRTIKPKSLKTNVAFLPLLTEVSNDWEALNDAHMLLTHDIDRISKISDKLKEDVKCWHLASIHTVNFIEDKNINGDVAIFGKYDAVCACLVEWLLHSSPEQELKLITNYAGDKKPYVGSGKFSDKIQFLRIDDAGLDSVEHFIVFWDEDCMSSEYGRGHILDEIRKLSKNAKNTVAVSVFDNSIWDSIGLKKFSTDVVSMMQGRDVKIECVQVDAYWLQDVVDKYLSRDDAITMIKGISDNKFSAWEESMDLDNNCSSMRLNVINEIYKL